MRKLSVFSRKRLAGVGKYAKFTRSVAHSVSTNKDTQLLANPTLLALLSRVGVDPKKAMDNMFRSLATMQG